MRPRSALIGCLVAAAMIAAPLSSASAHWRHRGLIGGVFGAAGALVAGAATVATAPLAIVADAAGGGRADGQGYGAPPPYAYRGYYGGPGYYRRDYYGPPRRYHRRREWYGPPPGY